MKNKKLLFLFLGLVFPMLSWAQLSGNYTIDPAGSGSQNYTSFAAAIAAMTSQGIGGNVTFEVSDGLYGEQVVIDNNINVVGTGPYNVVFRGLSGNPATCILRKPAIGTPPSNIGVGIGTLNFRGAGTNGSLRISFEGIGIQNFETGNQRAAVHIYGADDGLNTFAFPSRNISFGNCQFLVDTTLTNETVNQLPVMVLNADHHGGTGSGGSKYPAENISFHRCLFKGGTYGLRVIHGNGADQAVGFYMDSCEVRSTRVAAIEIDGYKDVRLSHSMIHEWKGTFTNNLGVRFTRCSDFTLRGNYIDGRRVALWIQVAPTYPGTPVWSRIENNYMHSGVGYVVYGQGQRYIEYYHNTFKSYNTSVHGVDIIKKLSASRTSPH